MIMKVNINYLIIIKFKKYFNNIKKILLNFF